MRPLEAARALRGVFSALLAPVSFQEVRGACPWERASCALEVVVRCPSLVEEALSSSLAGGRVEEVLASLAEVVVRRPSLVEEGVVLTSRP